MSDKPQPIYKVVTEYKSVRGISGGDESLNAAARDGWTFVAYLGANDYLVSKNVRVDA